MSYPYTYGERPMDCRNCVGWRWIRTIHTLKVNAYEARKIGRSCRKLNIIQNIFRTGQGKDRGIAWGWAFQSCTGKYQCRTEYCRIQTPKKALLERSENLDEAAKEEVKHVNSTCGVCPRSGEPRRLKKLSICKMNWKFNDVVKIDVMYWGKTMNYYGSIFEGSSHMIFGVGVDTRSLSWKNVACFGQDVVCTAWNSEKVQEWPRIRQRLATR